MLKLTCIQRARWSDATYPLGNYPILSIYSPTDVKMPSIGWEPLSNVGSIPCSSLYLDVMASFIPIFFSLFANSPSKTHSFASTAKMMWYPSSIHLWIYLKISSWNTSWGDFSVPLLSRYLLCWLHAVEGPQVFPHWHADVFSLYLVHAYLPNPRGSWPCPITLRLHWRALIVMHQPGWKADLLCRPMSFLLKAIDEAWPSSHHTRDLSCHLSL